MSFSIRNTVLFQRFGGTLAAFPSTSILDTFTNTDGVDLVVHSANWIGTIFNTGDSGLEIDTNAAALITSTFGTCYWGTNFGPDCEVFAKIVNSARAMRLYARLVQEGVTSTVDGYSLEYISATSARLRRIINGNGTTIADITARTFATGDLVGLECIGSTIKAYHKPGAGAWAEIVSVSDATHGAAGKIGLACLSTSPTADDFGGGTVVSGTPPADFFRRRIG